MGPSCAGIARWSRPGYSLLFSNIQPVSIMKISEYTKARLAVSFFFAASTIFYAILLSRMPALKSQVGADEAEVGLIILSLGLCGFAALLGSARALRCFGSGRLCRWSAALMVVSLLVAMFAVNVWQLAIGVGIFGFFMGMLDACVNTQGMLIEKHFSRPSMSFLHAFYGFGIFLGSASGSVFSSLSLSPLPNVAFFAALFFLLFLPACRSLQHEDEPQAGRGGTKESGRIPLFVIGCGLGYLLIEAVEGSSGDWGSLYLFSVKGADEKTAALAYGAYGSAAAVCRLFGDRMRARFGDRTLSVAGSAIAFCGLAVALFAGNPLICLAGYAILGAGQGVPQIRAVSVDAQNAPEAFPEPGRGGGGGEAGLKHHARLHAGPGQRGQREKEGRSLGEGVQLPRTEGIEALSERPGPGAEACHGEDNEQNEDESQEKAA